MGTFMFGNITVDFFSSVGKSYSAWRTVTPAQPRTNKVYLSKRKDYEFPVDQNQVD